ncbi:MAG TPA: serine hydrolase domain-containing protein [Candidatus Dormibacteraeota bacterium]|nr:serine hydrolase domain-containing protein [Candidatus Dormibacteraeota bacterium]
MKRKLFLAAIFLILCVTRAQSQSFSTWADDYFTQVVPKGNFRGVVLVRKESKVFFEKGFGLAVDEWNIPNNPDSIFEIASLTKQFTAAAILQLFDSGKIKLTDPVKKYYQDAPESWSAITIHHLLTHTSGIPNNDLSNYTKGICVSYSTDELIKTFKDRPLAFTPGTKWAYTNTEYYLLAYIIEKVSGEGYADYLRHHIFIPLGMKNSGFASTVAVVPQMVDGYTHDNNVLRHRDYFDRSLELGAGGIHTNLQDLVKWNKALDVPGFLSGDSLKLMFTPHPPGDYGYGWFVQEKPRLKAFHEGNDPGFAAFEIRYPKEHVLIVVLANEDDAPVREVAESLAKQLLGE